MFYTFFFLRLVPCEMWRVDQLALFSRSAGRQRKKLKITVLFHFRITASFANFFPLLFFSVRRDLPERNLLGDKCEEEINQSANRIANSLWQECFTEFACFWKKNKKSKVVIVHKRQLEQLILHISWQLIRLNKGKKCQRKETREMVFE